MKKQTDRKTDIKTDRKDAYYDRRRIKTTDKELGQKGTYTNKKGKMDRNSRDK